MKHQPAARHSAFYWRDGYQQQIDWTNGKRAALSRIKTAKELVAGQAHEMTAVPYTHPRAQETRTELVCRFLL